MSVQVFTGTTTEAAMSRVRKALGEEAIIVDVRGAGSQVAVLASSPLARNGKFRARGLGRIDGERTERAGKSRVGSSVDAEAAATSGERGAQALLSRKLRQRPVSVSVPAAPAVEAVAPVKLDADFAEPIGELQPVSMFLEELRAADLPEDVAQRLADIGDDTADRWTRVLGWLESLWPVAVPRPSRPEAPLVIAFIGPRGVGRTALSRGLAARAAIASEGSVLWLQVGFPGRRIGEADDLSAPIGVDQRVAHYVGEFSEIARDHRHAEVVLIDLPGIDVHDAEERAALQRFVQGARHVFRGLVLHAVLPATWSVRQASRCVAALAEFPLQGLAWTWIDEAIDSVGIVGTTVRTQVPPSFVHGDRVGDGSTSRVADWNPLLKSLSSRSAAAGQ